MKLSCWHQSQDNQISAPLIWDLTVGSMTKEAKDVCPKFESVKGRRVMKKAGSSLKLLAKPGSLKRKGCRREQCFLCGKVRRLELVTRSSARVLCCLEGH